MTITRSGVNVSVSPGTGSDRETSFDLAGRPLALTGPLLHGMPPTAAGRPGCLRGLGAVPR